MPSRFPRLSPDANSSSGIDRAIFIPWYYHGMTSRHKWEPLRHGSTQALTDRNTRSRRPNALGHRLQLHDLAARHELLGGLLPRLREVIRRDRLRQVPLQFRTVAVRQRAGLLHRQVGAPRVALRQRPAVAALRERKRRPVLPPLELRLH